MEEVPPVNSEFASASTWQIFDSNSLLQNIGFKDQGLKIVTDELEGDTWERSEYYYSASFTIHFVSARTVNEFYIAGLSASGEDVIEKWTIVPPRGYRQATRTTSTEPLGTPVPNPTTTSVFVAGDPVLFADRPRLQPTVNREEIYRGHGFGGFRALSVDPDGRFLLVVADSDSTLRYVILNGTNQVLTAYNSTQISTLQRGLLFLIRFQHTMFGRVYVLYGLEGGGMSHTLLFDVENDGIFEQTEEMDYDTYMTDWAEQEVWVDDFITLNEHEH